MSSNTNETNRLSSQRDFAKAHGHTHILIESCQRNLDSFFSTFESLRVTLLSVIDDYEKLLRDTNLESVLRSLKDTVTWIFEPVKDSSLSLSSNAKAAFSDLSEIITQRNRGLKDSVGQLPKKNNPSEPPINGTDPQRGYWKMSKQEINNQKARILQPCIEQLVDMLVVFFQEGLQRIYSQQDAPSEPSHPADSDASQVTPVFTSLPSVLQVATANWYVASQTGTDVRQHEVSLPLLSASDGLTRGEGAAYASKQLMEYSEHLERSPFKRFQVIGGYQYNPSDMCRAMDRYVTEQEMRELNRFYLQEAQRMEEGADPCEMPEDTSYVIDGVDVAGKEGRERVREEIERLCARVCGDVSLEKMSRIANFITYEVCSEIPEKSAWISAVLLYGKAHLVDIAKYLADSERNKITISKLHDRVGLKVEEVMKWEVLPSNVVENWNVTNKQHIAIIETGYKKDFEFKTAEDAIQVETVDVGLHSINSEFRIVESEQEAAGDHTPLLPVQRHTHRTLSLPPSSGDCEEAGKLPGRHQALHHTLSMHFPDEPGRYGAYLRRESRPHFSSSRSKTGSSESISSASTLKAGNHVMGEDDVRQQLFQGTAFQHLPWPREDAVLGQESGAERSDFFLDLFCKTNQDLNNSDPKETKRSGLTPAKDRTGRAHKRTMSTDFSQPTPSPPPERHQSVNNLAASPSLTRGQDEVGQDWINSLSSDNKCQSWPSLFGVLDLDSSPPKDSHSNQLKSKDPKPEEEFDGTHINSIFNTISLAEDSKDFHSSDSEIWPSKSIWGGEGLNLPKSTSFSSDSEPEGKDSFPRPKEITRTKYKTVFSEGKHPKVKHSIPRPPPFSPANSPQPRPLYHQPSPPPPPPPHPQHWDPKCHTDPNMRNPHPPPPPLWNGAPWHEGAPPPPPMPPMHPHGPHPGQWRPPPPGANMPPHPHPMPHPPPQGLPPHGLYHTPPPPPPPHFPPPPRLHTTPSPLSVPPDSPRVPPLPPHQGLHPPSSGPPLHPPTSTGPPHPPGGQPPPHPPSSPAPPLSNSPIPPNQPPPPQYHPYPPPMHPSMMDPSHLHNQPLARGPPPYFVQRMPHQPHPNFYPIPNSNW